MKIAIFHELHAGGARRASNEYARCLKKNHSVDLYIVDEKRNNEENIFYSSITYYSFIPEKWLGKNWKSRVYKDSLELLQLYKLHKKIASEINSKNYDVILVFPSRYTQAPFILKFLKQKKVFFAMEPLRLVYDPTVSIPEGLDIFRYSYEKLNRFNRKLIDKNNIAAADIIIGPSKFSTAFSKRVYKRDVKVSYVGLHTDFFTDSNEKRDIDILFIGSKDPFDGYEFFKKILTYTKRNYSVREVLFENEWLNDNQIRELYRKTRILVATSYNELLGMIPLEAMGCGVVILAVDEAGYKESIKNNFSGYLIKRDAKKFAQKLDFLLNNTKQLIKMSVNASKHVHDFWDWEERTKELEKYLK